MDSMRVTTRTVNCSPRAPTRTVCRTATEPFGDFDFGRDARALFEASVDNIFVLKFNY